MARASVPNKVAFMLMEGCRQKGVPTEHILDELNLPHDYFETNEGSFPISKIGELVKAIATVLNDECLGFMDKRLDPGGIATSINAIITATTLEQALSRWMKFWQIGLSDLSSSLTVEEDVAYFEFTLPQTVYIHFSCYPLWTALLSTRLSSWLIDETILIERAYFQSEQPPGIEKLYTVFPEMHFAHKSNLLIFSKEYLQREVVKTPGDVAGFLEILPYLLSESGSYPSLESKIKHLLSDSGNINALPLKSVANTLHKSVPTLQRALKMEGVSFAQIKESVRQELAVYHLKSGELSLSDVSNKLGFANVTAFNRAFKSWTGETPGAYRKKFHL